MAIRNIIFEGNEILRKKSRRVEIFDERLQELLDDLKETMHKFDGVGIAAVQVGVLKRVLLIDIHGTFLECINPEIIKQEGEQETLEGCLSVKNCNAKVKRPFYLTIKAQNRNGEPFSYSCQGQTAVVLCHEIDHLDGILFTDRVDKK